MKLAISLLLLLSGMGFGQMGTTCNGGGVGPIIAKKPKPYAFKLPSSGAGGGGGVSHGVMVPFHIGCIITCPPCQTTCPPDPVDVPAIREKRQTADDVEPPYPAPVTGMCYHYSEGTKQCDSGLVDDDATSAKRQEWAILHSNWIERQKHRVDWTCTDKERGLWRSESGKFYCRKAQL